MPTLLLIDGHSQAYRAFYGVKTPLMTRRGELTTAVFGFTRKLLSVLKEYQPEYVAVAFDVGDTWRHAAFPDYKATRDSMPEEMHTQMDRIEEILEAFNIPIVTRPGYEADDVLGSLATDAAQEDVDVLILTGDRDMFQLVSNRVKILYTRGGPNPTTDLYGPEEVEERYDLSPKAFVEMKALTGDKSDNIPGVSGVGEKTAVKFLKQYGSIENLYDHIDEVRGPKTQQNLREAQPEVMRNIELVTIVTDLDVEFDEAAFRLRDYDPAQIKKVFEELEFRSFLKELSLTGPEDLDSDDSGQLSLFVEPEEKADGAEIGEHPYLCVQDEETLQEVVAALASAQRISFDVETTSTDPMRAQLVGLGLAWDKRQAAYIPVGHSQGQQLAWADVRQAIQPYLADSEIDKLAHNAKYDLIVCRRHGLAVEGTIHDTMTMAWLLDPSSRSLNLKDQAAVELNWSMMDIQSLIGSGRKQVTMDAVDIESVTAYCGADVDATIHLYDALRPRLQEAGMWDLYTEIELPLMPVLADMEMAGILLDTDFLEEMSTQLAERLAQCEWKLFEIVGHEFNLRSTQQLSQVLFEELAFPTQGLRKTRSGFISTAASELEKLAAKTNELSDAQQTALEAIFEHRQLEKLRGTYVDALPELVHPETKRLHTSFNQTGTSTGRLSSSNPNLQNIPIRTELGREIRRAFIAPPDWVLIAADYSQVELRILAHVVQDDLLMEAFHQGQDIHAVTASRLFDVPLDQVSYEQRSLGKSINFATIYGVSAYGLSTYASIDPAEAQRFLDQYFATYPTVQQYITDTIEKANEEGYVETLLGRKRFFPELKSSRLPYNQRQALERAAINAPIQGTAADIIKIAMIHLHDRLQDGGYRARMLLQVHDELVLEVPEEERADVIALMRTVMESAYKLDVPLKVEVEVGPNWYEMESV